MKKYKPANLQSIKEFIQRMLDGERFYSEDYELTFYFDSNNFNCINKYNHVHPFLPCYESIVKSLQVEVPYTIQDAIAEKPRLCWVWIDSRDKAKLMVVNRYDNASDCPFVGSFVQYKHAELATLEEIKHYLED